MRRYAAGRPPREKWWVMFPRSPRTPTGPPQVWVVQLETAAGGLGVAAVTGSMAEGQVLVEQALSAWPGRDNALESYDIVLESPVPGRASASWLRPGERRTVHVLTTDDWIDVFESRQDGERERQACAARGDVDPQLVEVVTNTWPIPGAG